MRIAFLLLPLASIMAGVSVNADTILMKNGDRISGEIKKMWDNEILIDPAYADEFNVKLAHVSSIETDSEFEVELEDGAEGDYLLVSSSEEGYVVLKSEESEISVALQEIRKVAEIEKYFKWDTKADINQTVSRGNTDSDVVNFNGNLKLKWGDHRTTFDLITARENNEGKRVKESDRLNVTYNWSFNEPWFLGANASFERDPIALIDYRSSVNPALGYDIWDDPNRTFNIQLGAGYQTEKIDNEVESGGVIDWRLRFEYDLLGDDLEVFHNHQIYQNLTGRENLGFYSVTGLRYDIYKDIYLNVQLNYDYNSEPAEGTENANLTYVFGAGVKF